MCTGRGSNQGPVGPKSDALTTATLRHLKISKGKIVCVVDSDVVSRDVVLRHGNFDQ